MIPLLIHGAILDPDVFSPRWLLREERCGTLWMLALLCGASLATRIAHG